MTSPLWRGLMGIICKLLDHKWNWRMTFEGHASWYECERCGIRKDFLLSNPDMPIWYDPGDNQ
jgi:hypothetical protein